VCPLCGLAAATHLRAPAWVTGKRCGDVIDPTVFAGVTAADLIVGIRFDHMPERCIEGLRRIAAMKKAKAGSRDLAKADLHGLSEARGLRTPSPTSARGGRGVFPGEPCRRAWHSRPRRLRQNHLRLRLLRRAGLYMVCDANLAAWQAAGDGHLGHLLRAMRKSFDEARANAPACVFIDEIDSFA
jgi:cell division protease FtsH